jgi:DHA3 family macrolide efflux protein-like MFS transporter
MAQQTIEDQNQPAGWDTNWPASGWRSNWRLNFFSMWTGQALSLFGSRVVQFSLIWYLTSETGSATVLATAAMVGLIPEIFLGPIAGAYVDRWNRRLILIASDASVALLSLLLAYLFWIGAVQIWHIYAIMFLRSLLGSFHWPAMQASTSLMVPDNFLIRVAGLNQTVYGALSIVAPPLGALLLVAIPIAGVMLVDVVTFLIAIVPLLFVYVPRPRRKPGQAPGQEKPSVWSDLVEGFRYVAGWRGLMVLIGAVVIIKIALTPATTLLPLLVSAHFSGGVGHFAAFETAIGLGILLGGLTLSLWGGFKRRIYTSLAGFAVLGLGMLALGLVPAGLFGLALASVFMVGFTIPLIDGPIMAIMQARISPEMQGRVFTLLGSLVALSSPLSLAIAGPVSDLAGLQIWFLLSGLICIAVGIALFFVPSVINIEENGQVAGETADS